MVNKEVELVFGVVSGVVFGVVSGVVFGVVLVVFVVAFVEVVFVFGVIGRDEFTRLGEVGINVRL